MQPVVVLGVAVGVAVVLMVSLTEAKAVQRSNGDLDREVRVLEHLLERLTQKDHVKKGLAKRVEGLWECSACDDGQMSCSKTVGYSTSSKSGVLCAPWSCGKCVDGEQGPEQECSRSGWYSYTQSCDYLNLGAATTSTDDDSAPDTGSSTGTTEDASDPKEWDTILATVSKAPVVTSGTPLTAAQKQEILDAHNALRAGEGASDMTQMVWDEKLATMAQGIADLCKFDHSSSAFRQNQAEWGYWYVGENIYITSADSFQASDAARGWWAEKADYTYSTSHSKECTENKQCGHYTQMAWSSSYALGCGAKFCSNNDFMNYIGSNTGFLMFCNYGPGGNVNTETTPIYTKGAACSACPAGHTGGCSDSLCTA